MTGQNTSSAVMAQRVEAHDSLERWMPIADWSGYEISDHGRVRSWKQRSKGRTWKPRYDLPPRILKSDLRNGYPSVVLSQKGCRPRHATVHRLVLTAFKGPCPAGWHGAHNDGDPTNNRLSNLRWATPADNNADKKAHGTEQCGERSPSAKLTSRDVLEMRQRRAAGEKVLALAKRFGVCRNTVTNALRGHTWKSTAPCRRVLQREGDYA